MTIDQQVEAVRKVNGALNLAALQQSMTTDEWNGFIDLLDSGRLIFSGDPSGFHIKGDGFVHDCAHPDTTLV